MGRCTNCTRKKSTTTSLKPVELWRNTRNQSDVRIYLSLHKILQRSEKPESIIQRLCVMSVADSNIPVHYGNQCIATVSKRFNANLLDCCTEFFFNWNLLILLILIVKC